MRAVALAAMLAAGLAACAPPPKSAWASLSSAPDPALRTAIDGVVGNETDRTRTVIRTVGDDEARLALVYLVGPNWCGTGGCQLLILRPMGTAWTTVGDVSRVRPPVRLLTTTSHGLPDLGVVVSGGGGPPAHEARLTFDGRTYPRFPSDEPLIGAEGAVVIGDADLPPVV